jgi:transposase InsO family protein
MVEVSIGDAQESLEVFRRRYNEVRPHWALMPPRGGYVLTPTDAYVHGQAIQLPRWQSWTRAAQQKLKYLAQERPPGLPAVA